MLSGPSSLEIRGLLHPGPLFPVDSTSLPRILALRIFLEVIVEQVGHGAHDPQQEQASPRGGHGCGGIQSQAVPNRRDGVDRGGPVIRVVRHHFLRFFDFFSGGPMKSISSLATRPPLYVAYTG